MIPVVGLDPSLRATGLALPDGELLTITTPACKKGCPLDERIERMRHIVGRVGVRVKIGCLVVIEGAALHSNNNDSHELAGIWWKLVVRLAEQGNQIAVVGPGQLKKFATGSGAKDPGKARMREALRQHAGLDMADHNQVDAFWLRQAGLVRQGHPDALSLPKVQTAVLDGIAWPEGIGS